MEAGIIFKIALAGIRAAGGRFVHTDIHPVLKGEINAFSLQGGKINSLYDFQRFPALGDIHPDRLVVDYGKIEITDRSIISCCVIFTPICALRRAYKSEPLMLSG